MSDKKTEAPKLLKQVSLLQRIAFLDGQREMSCNLSIWENEKPLVILQKVDNGKIADGFDKIPWEDFVRPIDDELRELRAQAGMPEE